MIFKNLAEFYRTLHVPENQRELMDDYLKADRFMVKLMLAHWILASTLSGYFYDTYLLGFIGGAVLFFITLISYRIAPGTPIFRIVAALALMSFSIIFIQQHLGRIEMHFHVFVALSFLPLYKDYRPVTVAAVYIILHHLLFNYLQAGGVTLLGVPVVVFNYGCGMDIVLLHAFFVIFEWFVLIRIIMNQTQTFLREIRYKNEALGLNKNLEMRVSESVKRIRQQEQVMIQQAKMAEMGEMMSSIAHQWRQPLSVMGLEVQDLRDAYEFGELDDAYLERAVKTTLQQIKYMSKTIDDFRNFFKPDKAKEDFSIQEIIGDIVGIVAAQLRHYRIAILAEGEDFTLQSYPNELKQVILNLVNNAKDAIIERNIPHGKIVLKTVAGEIKKVIVEDNGGGIDPEIRSKIFEPYFTTKHKSVGTGIGLYMVKTILERHQDAAVYVEETEEGTRFTIEFYEGHPTS